MAEIPVAVTLALCLLGFVIIAASAYIAIDVVLTIINELEGEEK